MHVLPAQLNPHVSLCYCSLFNRLMWTTIKARFICLTDSKIS
jgi:hypothetical protein